MAHPGGLSASGAFERRVWNPSGVSCRRQGHLLALLNQLSIGFAPPSTVKSHRLSRVVGILFRQMGLANRNNPTKQPVTMSKSSGRLLPVTKIIPYGISVRQATTGRSFRKIAKWGAPTGAPHLDGLPRIAYSTMFSQKFMRICATSARVASPMGSRMPLPLPLSRPALTAQVTPSSAQSEMSS